MFVLRPCWRRKWPENKGYNHEWLMNLWEESEFIGSYGEVLAYPMLIDCLHLGIDAGESAIMFESEPAIQFVCMVTVPFLCGVFIFVYRSPEQDMWAWAFRSG